MASVNRSRIEKLLTFTLDDRMHTHPLSAVQAQFAPFYPNPPGPHLPRERDAFRESGAAARVHHGREGAPVAVARTESLPRPAPVLEFLESAAARDAMATRAWAGGVCVARVLKVVCEDHYVLECRQRLGRAIAFALRQRGSLACAHHRHCGTNPSSKFPGGCEVVVADNARTDSVDTAFGCGRGPRAVSCRGPQRACMQG